jgi:hypothetical protein
VNFLTKIALLSIPVALAYPIRHEPAIRIMPEQCQPRGTVITATPVPCNEVGWNGEYIGPRFVDESAENMSIETRKPFGVFIIRRHADNGEEECLVF